MASVIKRSKKMQKFSKAKLGKSIENAAKQAKISKAQREKLAEEVAESICKHIQQKRSITTTELRKRTLQRLDSRSKATARAWQRYDRKKRKKTRK